MKKLVSFFLTALLLFSAASADPVDLSGLSFDELVALRDQINLAIWNSQEWQEVTVPAGIWQVGKDIPAGHWSIRVAAEKIISTFHVLTNSTKSKKGRTPARASFRKKSRPRATALSAKKRRYPPT